jgi:hypothetical protein
MATGLPGLGGWIAPDGRFWPSGDADHQRHQAVAERIVAELGIETAGRDPAHQLERLGWAHLHYWGFTLSHHGYDWALTQAQMDRLFDLAQDHGEMRDMILTTIRTQARCEERGWRWFGWSDLLPEIHGI